MRIIGTGKRTNRKAHRGFASHKSSTGKAIVWSSLILAEFLLTLGLTCAIVERKVAMLAVIALLWQRMCQVIINVICGVALERMKSIINSWLVQVMRIIGTGKRTNRKAHRGFASHKSSTGKGRAAPPAGWRMARHTEGDSQPLSSATRSV